MARRRRGLFPCLHPRISQRFAHGAIERILLLRHSLGDAVVDVTDDDTVYAEVKSQCTAVSLFALFPGQPNIFLCFYRLPYSR